MDSGFQCGFVMKKVSHSLYKYHFIGITAIFLICIAIYANTLHGPFVYDDIRVIMNNSHLRLKSLDIRSLSNLGSGLQFQNRPIPNISFALNYYLGRYSVPGYHVVNILIHIMNGILVYLLAMAIFIRIHVASDIPINRPVIFKVFLMALFAALVFVTHPLQTQSVTYIVQRMNSMAAMFFLLSLYLYIRGRNTTIRWHKMALIFSSLVSWILALGSKPIAVTLPVIVFIYEWYFFQDLSTAWLKRNLKLIPIIAVTGCLLVMIFLGSHPLERVSATFDHYDFSMWERIMTQFRVVIFYISLLIYPHPSRLNLLHPFTTSHSFLDPFTTLLSFLVLMGLITCSILIARKNPLVSFGILWFLINLLVESSVIGLEMTYEHRLYLPMFGFALILSSLLSYLFSKKRTPAIVVAMGIIVFLGVGANIRNRVWQDGVMLWSDIVSKNPQSFVAQVNLGFALADRGMSNDAVRHYMKALQINPSDTEAHNNLGLALAAQGKHDEAIKHYMATLNINPNHVKALNNLGLAMALQGRIDEAVSLYTKALKIDPDFAGTHHNLGLALADLGREKEAIEQYTEALRLDSGYAAAHNNLGVALIRQGMIKEAVGHFMDALKINPGYANAHNNLGTALARQGDLDGAIIHFEKATRAAPDFAEAYSNLGRALALQGRHSEAIPQYVKALEIMPNYAKAHNYLGIALARQGDLNGAVGHFAEALRLRPDYTEARRNLEQGLQQIGHERMTR